MRFVRSDTNWEGRKWIVNPAIDSLCSLVEQHWPESHPTDGTVASKTHDQINPNSDHRPFPYSGTGVVYAADVGEVTEDDGAIFAEALRASRDSRIRYVIHETRLFSSYATTSRQPWAWGPYSGANPHGSHVHVSVWRTAGPGEWNLDLGDDMVTRSDKADEGLAPLAPTFTRALAAGYATTHTQPGGVAFNDEILAMLERMGLFGLVERVAALEASDGGQPHTHPFQGTTGIGG